MTRKNIHKIAVSLAAALSIAGAMVPVAQAETTQEVKDKGYSCEHTADNFTTCTNSDGHEYWCEESTDSCAKIKLEVAKKLKFLGPVKVYAPVMASATPSRTHRSTKPTTATKAHAA